MLLKLLFNNILILKALKMPAIILFVLFQLNLVVESTLTCFPTIPLPIYFGGLSSSDYEINTTDVNGDYIVFSGVIYNYPTTPV
jgi:hypothetical protein